MTLDGGAWAWKDALVVVVVGSKGAGSHYTLRVALFDFGDRERGVNTTRDPAGSGPAVCAGAGTADVEVILIVGFFSGVVAVDEGEIDPEFLARDACHRCGVIIDIACFIEDRRGAIA